MDILHEGEHEVVVIGTALDSDKTGDIVVKVMFGLGEDKDCGITAWLYTTPKAWPYTDKKLKALGWDAQKEKFTFYKFDEEPGPIDGAFATIVVSKQMYNGKPQYRVDSINGAGGGGGVDRLDPAVAKQKSEELRRRILASRGPAASASAGGSKTPVRASAHPATEEDVPY